MKALVLDCFYDELKKNTVAQEVFTQLNATTLQQKLENHFQILEKSQALEATQLSRDELKAWIRSKLLAWMHLRSDNNGCSIFGDMEFIISDHPSAHFKLHSLDFKWSQAIQQAAQLQGQH